MVSDKRLGANGARPEVTLSGRAYDYPNVTIVKLGGGYRVALDTPPTPDQDVILDELRTLIALETPASADTAPRRTRLAKETVVDAEGDDA